jgi:hypothetical protein
MQPLARFVLCLISAAASAAADPVKKVLIIGIDGLQPSALTQTGVPNLNALAANGCLSTQAVTHPVTHSAACWSSMFTGVWGDKHGVNDPGNSFAGNRFALYPNFMKRLEAMDSNLNTVVYARWADLTNATAGADLVQTFGTDSAITTATVYRLTNATPDVFYTILRDVDSAGHSSGWGSAGYLAAVTVADGRVGQIVTAVTRRATYALEDWLIIVLSDHGAHDGTIAQTRLTLHLVSGAAAARGTTWPVPSMVDVWPTVFAHLGYPINPAWNLDGRVEGLPRPGPAYGSNLIFNGGAEANQPTNTIAASRGMAWWANVSSLTLTRYGATNSALGAGDPGPPDRGNNLFQAATNTDTMFQTVDLSALAADVDAAAVDYRLAGFFGGASNRNDSLKLTVRFLDASRAPLRTNAVGGVTAAQRTNVTGLLEREAGGLVPAGTRLVEFTLSAQGASGANVGAADALSFVLERSELPPAVPQWADGTPDQGVRIGVSARPYWEHWLERSEDFAAWTTLPVRVSGGGALILLDPDPPDIAAFYRILSTPE